MTASVLDKTGVLIYIKRRMRMNRKKKAIANLIVLLLMLFAVSCGVAEPWQQTDQVLQFTTSTEAVPLTSETPHTEASIQVTHSPVPADSTEELTYQSITISQTTAPEANATERHVDVAAVDLSLKPSEGGKIMVLMYHNIGPEEAEWTRTPENFRADLELLYEKGYRPIRLSDYVRGHIDTPAGLTPYVITFDDARENNFRYLEDGSIDPDSAVGVLLAFAAEHDDFSPHATFFVNGRVPFRVEGEEEKKVSFLIENGMDIGNHSDGHENYTSIDAAGLQKSIGRQANYLESLTPQDYKVNTFALPFGIRPRDKALHRYLEKGEYEGKTYENIAVLNVGWDPWYSPFHKNFDPLTIHRIRASEMNVDDVGIRDWIRYFDEKPEARFISDGFADIISAPASFAEVMVEREGKILNLYESED